MNANYAKYTRLIGQWAFFIGMVLALLTVFISLGGWVTQVLLILGILAGLFHQKIKEELITFGILYLALAATAAALSELLVVGTFISDIAAAWVGFLGPVVLIAFMFWGGAFLMVNRGDGK